MKAGTVKFGGKKEENKGANGGNKFSVLDSIPHNQQSTITNTIQFNAPPSKLTPRVTKSANNGNKRLCKDSGSNSSPPQQGVPPKEQQTRLVSMGGVPAQVTTDGTCSTMAMVPMGGARYQISLNDNHELGSSSLA